MVEFCRQESLPFELCGKLVVAADDSERDALSELESRGRKNGLAGLERVGPARIREIEPAVAGVDALYVPEAGITDYRAVTERLSAPGAVLGR